MPEQLKVHSGERVDLVDYVHGSNTYTQETQKFLLEREWLDRRSRILDGFRIQVEDQITNPGMITVYNGNAVDRAGQLINNEITPNDSRSITLLGAGLNFYVEIEFILNESNSDARYFWDPTTPNTPPEPDGSEFLINVATRLTPDWRIVNPVSTTSFQQTATPGSIRVPVGVFRTDGFNRIVSGTNPGLTLVRAASVLETDVSLGATSIRVVDARVFPATVPFDVTVDFGAGSPENRTVSTVDRDNGILGLSVALGSAHLAGAIVRVTSGNPELVRENVDPNAFDPLATPPGHPDPAQRLWQANEVRGSALIQSKETFGSRDDLNIRSLKDQVDYLSAQIRELKFGSPRPEVVSAAPPSTFSTRPRWFDRAGSITGARSNTVSIGNGTTTFGDFNGTNGSTVLAAALAALPAGGGTIYVKSGTYNFATTVTVAKPVTIVGDSGGNTIFNNTNAAGPAIATTSPIFFRNMALQLSGGASVNVIDIAASTQINFDYCLLTGQIRIGNFNGRIVAENSSFGSSGSNAIINALSAASTLNISTFTNCTVLASGTFISCPVTSVRIQQCYLSAGTILSLPAGSCNVENFAVSNCTCDINKAVVLNNTTTGYVDGLSLLNCKLSVTTLNSNEAVFYLANTGNIDNVKVKDNYCNIVGGVQSAAFPAFFVYVENNTVSEGFQVNNNSIDAPVGSFIVGVKLDQDTLTGACTINDNYFFRCSRAVILGGSVGVLNSGELTIRGNVHDNISEHASVYGIVLANNGRLDRLNIQNNTFIGYAGTSVGPRVCIDLSTTNASLTYSNILISDNKFVNIGNTSGANAALGVVYNVNTASAMRYRFDIRDNYFSNFSSTADCAAIYLANISGTISSSASVVNNKIYDIGTAAAVTGDAYGVYLEGFSDSVSSAVTITNNFISAVLSATGSDVGSGIETSNCTNLVIANNYISNIRSLLTAGVPAQQSGCGIRVAGASGVDKISIVGNVVDQSTAATASEATLCIVLRSTGTITNFSVCDNILTSSTTTETVGGMIWTVVTGAGSESYRNGNISRNILDWRITSVSGQAIMCALGGSSYGINIADNIIRNTTYSASATGYRGIEVRGYTTGGTPRDVQIRGNTLTGPKSGALLTSANRVGIRLRGALIRTLVSNNLIDWNEVGVLEGIGIKYLNDGLGAWPGHLCAGNFIRADNSAVAGGEIDIDTAAFTDGYLVANQLGQGIGNVGTVVPGVVAGGWDYGAGTGGGTYLGINKLS